QRRLAERISRGGENERGKRAERPADHLPARLRYSSTGRSISSCLGSDIFTLIIQAWPYGSRFTRPGLSDSAEFSSVTVPETPVYRSLVAFTDSISPKRLLASSFAP